MFFFIFTSIILDIIFINFIQTIASNSSCEGFQMVALEAYGVLYFKGIVNFYYNIIIGKNVNDILYYSRSRGGL